LTLPCVFLYEGAGDSRFERAKSIKADKRRHASKRVFMARSLK